MESVGLKLRLSRSTFEQVQDAKTARYQFAKGAARTRCAVSIL